MRLKRSWAGTTHAISGTHVAGLSGNAGAYNDRSGHLMSAAPPRPRWMEDRGDLPCQQPHPDAAWFSGDKEDVATAADVKRAEAQRDRAIQLCGTCPMELDCREHGLRYHKFGIWGGVRQEPLVGTDRRRLLVGVIQERWRRAL